MSRVNPMKKIFFALLAVVFCSTTIYAAKPQTFCYENMCFNAKKWKNIQTGKDEKTDVAFILSSKAVAGGYGGIAIFLIQKSKSVEGMSIDEYATKRFQETMANYNTSNNTGSTKMSLVSQDGLAPFVVNTYNAKSFGMKLKQGIARVYQRIFIFEKDGYFYEIQTTSNKLNSDSHTKLFVKILNTLTLSA